MSTRPSGSAEGLLTIENARSLARAALSDRPPFFPFLDQLPGWASWAFLINSLTCAFQESSGGTNLLLFLPSSRSSSSSCVVAFFMVVPGPAPLDGFVHARGLAGMIGVRSCHARASHRPLTFVRRAIGGLASPKRRAELRRAGGPRGCRGSALPCAWTRRGGQDAVT